MHTAQRVFGSLTSAMLALALSACGDDAPTEPAKPAGPPGVTTATEIYGPRCDELPKSGPGSAEQMATQPAGTAIGTTPLLTRLGIQLRLTGLDQTLDKTDTGYTVFAPAGEAFKPLSHLVSELSKLPAANQPSIDPKTALKALFGYHVVPKRYSANELASAGAMKTLEGAPLTVSGDGLNLSVGAQRARVLCGNIPTANATVFVIDQVLIPPLSSMTLPPPS